MWRVAQEALANIERHSQATAVRVVWRCDGGRALIDVTDNGVGFDQSRAGRIDSYGVLGMRERASSIGATLEIVSAPGRGTRVRCTLTPSEVRTAEQPGVTGAPRLSELASRSSRTEPEHVGAGLAATGAAPGPAAAEAADATGRGLFDTHRATAPTGDSPENQR